MKPIKFAASWAQPWLSLFLLLLSTIPSTGFTIARSFSKTVAFASPSTAEKESTIFPPPLSPIERMKRATTFWLTVIPIVAKYYVLPVQIKLYELMGTNISEEQVEEMWNTTHKDGASKLASTVTDLKGFYPKVLQIISARRDLFPEEYIKALSGFSDNLDPMPVKLAKAVVESELLRSNQETFEDVFAEFDEKPLGAASIGQVHRAVLTEKYGGKEVAVKVQRPSVESQLLGDIENLMAVANAFRGNPNMPLDYYTVFSELEKQMVREFDFIEEAAAMDQVHESLACDPIDGTPRKVPIVMPRPVQGLVSRRVLVMDYLQGFPLSRAGEEMAKRGLQPDAPEAKLLGRRLVSALTVTFGRNILETGFFHGDPHPGNIFLLEGGQPALIDFGQVKQISDQDRLTLCKMTIALDERQDGSNEDLELVGKLAKDLGLVVHENAKPEAAAAVAMWLFDGSVESIPGGYDNRELSPNSPMNELKTFPEDLVLVARSSVLIKALSRCYGFSWSLAKEWAPIARRILNDEPTGSVKSTGRFRGTLKTMKLWTSGKASKVARRLPSPMRSKAAKVALIIEERRSRHKLTVRKH